MKRYFTYKSLTLLLVAILAGCSSGNKAKPLIEGFDKVITGNAGQNGQEIDVDTDDNGTASGGLGLPAAIPGSGEQILHREAYTVSYNPDTKLPNWVAWQLTPERCSGPAKRKGVDFEEDTDVDEPRATDADYYTSGYDRGHMCPAGDNKQSMTAMRQSFLFTNICPQAPSLNRGDWNEMENACRRWAKDYGRVYIVCGPILYKGKHKTIGRNKVVVPEAFFKVVLRMGDHPEAIGFIYKNGDGNRPKGDYVNSVDEVERITGIDFFPSLPDNIEKKVEAKSNPEHWGI